MRGLQKRGPLGHGLFDLCVNPSLLVRYSFHKGAVDDFLLSKSTQLDTIVYDIFNAIVDFMKIHDIV